MSDRRIEETRPGERGTRLLDYVVFPLEIYCPRVSSRVILKNKIRNKEK